MLILLNNFMHLTATKCAKGVAPSKGLVPRPCDYFDLIAGTGTGGLIAIMLGRLRMDTEECMKVYVRMTRRVFETDKTIVGIPYRSTLFKASKLEEAIRECVREYDRETSSNRNSTASEIIDFPKSPLSPTSPGRTESVYSARNGRSRYSLDPSDAALSPVASTRSRSGRSNAPLYDARPNRTKTYVANLSYTFLGDLHLSRAVTAVLKGNRDGEAMLLRSYESPTQPSIEPECTIWEAGRATCATGLAFKPIQIGKSVFLDEGNGKYNPAPIVLEEAVQSEWPGRSVGVFLSIGTGKRPENTSHLQREWWEGFAGGMGEYAEAKRRLISKIEGCEKTHQEMLTTRLGKKYLSAKNYFRLNVEVGVGEFGMNEWSRLADISNSTNIYLSKSSVKAIIEDGANAMAEVHQLREPPPLRSKPGPEIYEQKPTFYFNAPTQASSPDHEQKPSPSFITPSHLNAVELPGDDQYPRPTSKAGSQYHAPSPNYTFQEPYASQVKSSVIPPPDERPLRKSNEYNNAPERTDGSQPYPPPRRSMEKWAPPLPPKTPINDPEDNRFARFNSVPHPPHPRYGPPPYPDSDGPPARVPQLPYPDVDGPPPVINMAKKPEYIRR